MTAPPFKDLDRIVRSMKAGVYSRFMRRAQKASLVEWRDRAIAPGVRARFTHAGSTYYRFSSRSWRGRRLPYYVHTGRLRDALMRRKPRSKNNRSSDVVTTLKYGGGALNFLGDKYGVMGRSVSRTSTTVTVTGHQRRAGGSSISVRSYQQRKHVDRAFIARSGKSYAAEFGVFVRDAPWIQRRTARLFMEIVRRSAIDRRTGGLKSSMLERMDNV